MTSFQALIDAGAAVACMSGTADGDCGWGGCATGARAAFLHKAGVPAGKLVVPRQCHGDRVLPVTKEDAGRGADGREDALAEADGLMTRHAGIPLGITVADCVPVFLSSPEAVGVVHAGRAGTALGIAGRAVKALVAAYGVEPSSLCAVIGPSAGPCCYEVSPDLRDSCVEAGMVARGRHLDLWASNRAQLQAAGLDPARIRLDGRCTICQAGFYSFRAHRTARRNLALIMR